MEQGRRGPWLYSAGVDGLLILLPPFAAVAAALLLRDGTAEVSLVAWLALVLCIDVAHVYSTLFRTYLDPAEFNERRVALTAVPLLCWIAGVFLYSAGAANFWRVLAYVAVFHFVRQQYGFMMLYSRGEDARTRKFKWIDKTLIYLATLYPVIYWHAHLPREFSWFVEGDFVRGVPVLAERVMLVSYFLAGAAYVLKEAREILGGRGLNLPKQLIILGTGLSWYVGIVALQGDLTFTLTNVVSHGIPYVGLIWIHGRKRYREEPEGRLAWGIRVRQVFSIRYLPLFAGVLLLLAYLEEALWAGLVWREHLAAFPVFSALPKVDDAATLSWLVPLLTLPQVTHYVLDGFIWRLKDKKAAWQGVVFGREADVR